MVNIGIYDYTDFSCHKYSFRSLLINSDDEILQKFLMMNPSFGGTIEVNNVLIYDSHADSGLVIVVLKRKFEKAFAVFKNVKKGNIKKEINKILANKSDETFYSLILLLFSKIQQYSSIVYSALMLLELPKFVDPKIYKLQFPMFLFSISEQKDAKDFELYCIDI
jgi:hypothetical protein